MNSINKSDKVYFYLTAAFWFFLDRVTKTAVIDSLIPGKSKDIIYGFLALTHIKNRGASFGMLQNAKWFFIAVALIFTILILVYIHFSKPDILEKLALGSLLGGALGNLADRVIYGEVTDFIDFYGIWPYVFNVADIAVCLGGITVILMIFFEYKRVKK